MNASEMPRDHNQRGYFITGEPIMKEFGLGWVYQTIGQERIKIDTIHDLAVNLKIKADASEN